MKKFKKLVCILTMATLGLFCFATPAQTNPQVFANISSDGSLDLGKYKERSTQSTINTYSTLGQHPLYVNGDESGTQALYTTRFTNMSGADPIYTINSGGSISFANNSISFSAGSSTSTSNRSQYLSHAFQLSNNLLQASKNGYLSVKVGANVSLVTGNDTFRMVLIAGTLDGYTSISAGTTKVTSEISSTSAVYQELAISNSTYSQYMVIGGTTRGSSGSWTRDTGMTFATPTLTISSTDTTKPTITKTISSEDWATSKTLTFTVSDSQSGLWDITSNVTLPTPTESNGVKTYKIPVNQNGDYTITVTDAVGNTNTVTHTENKIDTTAPNKVDVTMPSFSTYAQIAVIPTFAESGLNTETIYYTTDGTTPTKNSQTMLNGQENNVTLADGDHTLKFATIDQVGNVSEITEKTITINTHRYQISINNTHCDYTITKPTTFDTDNGDCAFYGETIRIDFTANENCIKSVLKVNGQEQTFENEYVEVVVNSDVTIEVCYDYQIQVTNFTPSYEYDPTIENLQVIYSINTTDNVNIQLTDLQGQPLSIKNVGTYDIMWKCNDYGYAGQGTFQIQITAIQVFITVQPSQSKIYGEADPQNYTYEVEGLPQSETLELTLTREQGEDVGYYQILLSEHNLSNNYIITFESDDFYIGPRKVVILANSFEKQYTDADPTLTYKFFQSELLPGDSLQGELTREQGEDIGEYVISIGTLSNPNYNILFMNGKLTINQKDIDVVINNIQTTYGEDKELTYETNLVVDKTEFSGALTREQGNNVGSYQITIGSLQSKNYNIVNVTNGVYEIAPKTAYVTAKAYSKVYGEKDVLEYEVAGLVYDDELVGFLTREQGEDVGTYAINQGSLANANYVIDFTSANLTITPAELVVVIANKTHTFGELEQDLEYTISGFKFDDQIELELVREQGNNAGEYEISAKEINNSNYYLNCTNGTYTITQASIVPTVEQTSFVYSGQNQYISQNSFPFELTYIYKQNGLECDGVLNFGEYQVQAIFAGNQNYLASQSEVVTVSVEKQKVHLTLSENQFVYDGQIKFPEFSYNTECGLSADSIVFKFQDDIMPTEVGEYPFTIVSENANYDCTISGVLVIANQLTINGTDCSITSSDATFDANAQNIVLVETKGEGKKFNEKVILSTVTFDNVSKDDKNIYTVKIKAKKDVETVYIYQVSADNSFREIAVKQIDGYYEFKVDNISDTFVLTRDVKPIPVWVWEMAGLVTIGGASFVLNMFRKRKKSLATNIEVVDENTVEVSLETATESEKQI